MSDDQEPQAFRSLPSGPQTSHPGPRQFQRHRILNDAQFGSVAVPEPIRRFVPEGMGEAWQGRAATSAA